MRKQILTSWIIVAALLMLPVSNLHAADSRIEGPPDSVTSMIARTLAFFDQLAAYFGYERVAPGSQRPSESPPEEPPPPPPNPDPDPCEVDPESCNTTEMVAEADQDG